MTVTAAGPTIQIVTHPFDYFFSVLGQPLFYFLPRPSLDNRVFFFPETGRAGFLTGEFELTLFLADFLLAPADVDLEGGVGLPDRWTGDLLSLGAGTSSLAFSNTSSSFKPSQSGELGVGVADIDFSTGVEGSEAQKPDQSLSRTEV